MERLCEQPSIKSLPLFRSRSERRIKSQVTSHLEARTCTMRSHLRPVPDIVEADLGCQPDSGEGSRVGRG